MCVSDKLKQEKLRKENVSHFLTFPDTFIELLTTNYKRWRKFLKIRMVESQGNESNEMVERTM